MTEITDQATRDMLEWARIAVASKDNQEHEPWVTAARYILATVPAPAPAPTLAEELRDTARWWRDGAPTWEQCCDRFGNLAARADQMDHDLAEARAEVERLKRDLAEAYKTRDARDDEVDRLRAEVERLTAEVKTLAAENSDLRNSFTAVQKGAESTDLPDPADVKPGEAWIVECRGERRTAVKDMDYEDPWYTVNADGWLLAEDDEDITLVSRLVPAPRAITNPDELDALAEGTIIRSRDGEACRKSDGGDWSVDGLDGAVGYGPRQVLPATVLWEP